MQKPAGYAERDYAYALQEYGNPRELPRSGGWIIERSIPGTSYRDAIGCYPLFSCRDWSRLPEDLEEIGSDLVSLTVVADPLSSPGSTDLVRYFNHVVPFKTHYLAHLNILPEQFVHRTHRRYVRRSLEKMRVEVCTEPRRYLEEWMCLYETLIRRHCIQGMRAFSRQCFAKQLNVSGMIMFLGRLERDIVGASLVMTSGPFAYFHLHASSMKGYDIHAAYGIHWTAINYCRNAGIRVCDIGGVAGMKDDPTSGLARFKRGWSNGRRIAYLCGSIFDRTSYEHLCRTGGGGNVSYFPAYRSENAQMNIDAA